MNKLRAILTIWQYLLQYSVKPIEMNILESSLQSVGRREGLTAGEIDWEVSATEKDG